MAIHIKPSHRGKLTAKAHRAGESLGEFERTHRNTSNAETKKEIVFAENAKHWKHGGRKHKGVGLAKAPGE
jgi:hypothetical protein